MRNDKLENFLETLENYKKAKTEISNPFSAERREAKQAYKDARNSLLKALHKSFFLSANNRDAYIELTTPLFSDRDAAQSSLAKLYNRFNFYPGEDAEIIRSGTLSMYTPQGGRTFDCSSGLIAAANEVKHGRKPVKASRDLDEMSSVSGGLERRAPITRTDSNVSVSKGKTKGVTL